VVEKINDHTAGILEYLHSSGFPVISELFSLVDGLKPGQRKVIFTCLKRNLTKKEIKVAQLSGSVAEVSTGIV